MLESALAQPVAAFAGEELHPTLSSKAAAYCFHLVKNHPFSDGNKRIASLAMGVFLQVNGVTLRATNDALYDTITAVAEGRRDKADLIAWIEAHTAETR